MNNLNIIDILADDENAAIELALDSESRAKLREIRAYIEHDEELVGMDIHEFENLSADEISRLAGRHLDPSVAAHRSAEITSQHRSSGWYVPPLATLALAMVASFCAVGIIFLASHMPSDEPVVEASPIATSGAEEIEADRTALSFSGASFPLAYDLTRFSFTFPGELPTALGELSVPTLPSFWDEFSELRSASSGWSEETPEDVALLNFLRTFQVQNRNAIDASVADNGWVASLNDLDWRTTLFSFEITEEFFSPYRAAPAVGLDRNQSHVLTQLLDSTDLVDATALTPGTDVFGVLVSRPGETTYPMVWVELRGELIPVQSCLNGIPELGTFLASFSDIAPCGGLRMEAPAALEAEQFDGAVLPGESQLALRP
jgi:hypothetical protein